MVLSLSYTSIQTVLDSKPQYMMPIFFVFYVRINYHERLNANLRNFDIWPKIEPDLIKDILNH